MLPGSAVLRKNAISEQWIKDLTTQSVAKIWQSSEKAPLLIVIARTFEPRREHGFQILWINCTECWRPKESLL